MGEIRPLTLKRQKPTTVAKLSEEQKQHALQVEVQIDTGVFHLDQYFSYLVSAELADQIHVGSIVQVPFRNESKIGVVVGIGPQQKTNLSVVEKLIVEHGCNEKYLVFIDKVAARYICPSGLIQKQLLLNISGKAGKLDSTNFLNLDQGRSHPKFHLLNIGQRSHIGIKNLLKDRHGSNLIIFPTQRELEHFKDSLNGTEGAVFIEYGSHQTLSDRKKAFARILNTPDTVVIGLRSAIFAPIRDLARIIVVDEYSEHYIDRRLPYWNLRDVALLRADSEGCQIDFIGNAASLELWRLIDSRWVELIEDSKSSKMRTKVATQPETFHSTIREGLKKGNVLISVSTKDYASGFICRKCRNRALCVNSHPLVLKSKNEVACSICAIVKAPWRCPECSSGEIFNFKPGATRVKEEVGKAFPRTNVYLSTAAKPLDELEKNNSIVISTYGVEPVLNSGYAAIALLDGEELSARAIIRSDEELIQRWNKILSLLHPGGQVHLSLLSKHPVAQSISANKVKLFLDTALRERQQVKLPPFSRIIQIQGESRSISGLRSKLTESFPSGLSCYVSDSGRVLTLQIDHELMPQIQTALKALQKMRSSGGKELLRIVVDPLYF